MIKRNLHYYHSTKIEIFNDVFESIPDITQKIMIKRNLHYYHSTKIEIFNDVFESIPDITQKNNDKKEPPLLP